MKTHMRDTSLSAYSNYILPRIAACERKVLEVIMRYDGITNREIAVQLGVSPSDISGRTNSLVKQGVVVDAGKKICSVTQKRVLQWIYVQPNIRPEVRKIILNQKQERLI
jgi:predicted transcriptional regulator